MTEVVDRKARSKEDNEKGNNAPVEVGSRPRLPRRRRDKLLTTEKADFGACPGAVPG